MLHSEEKPRMEITVNVIHDLQRQLLEIPSFLRVMNNYYQKKTYLQRQIKSLFIKRFKEGCLEDNKDWLHTIPTALNTLSDDFLNKKDSFKFPDNIILFEAWMHLGINALYPRVVLHFKFPGFLKGEKVRNVFQFIYSTSRGFGFPIYFGPEFYDYKLKLSKIFEPFLKWGYTVCHRANQAIVIGNRRLKLKRHHPGEFELVIISEYENNKFKAIDTLLHGYFTNAPRNLGKFPSLDDVLQNTTFSYSIGDHAMSVKKKLMDKTLQIPLLSHNYIVFKYGVDFSTYIKKLKALYELLIKKIGTYKEKRNSLINKLKKSDKIRFRLEQSKRFAKEFAQMKQKLSKKYPIIDKYGHYKTLLGKIKDLLFTTPLYMHAIHSTEEKKEFLKFLISKKEDVEEIENKSLKSIFLSFIKDYEKEYDFLFEEDEVLEELEDLKDFMLKIWLNFKEKHFNLALRRLNEMSTLSIEDPDYNKKINDYLDKLLPVFSIYEIFNRPLSESVYPESIPQNRRFGPYIAQFITSRYNPIGINLMKLFNRLSFYNWSYLVLKKKLNRKQFFNYILKLPIWKHIPAKIKMKILNYDT
ncbi:MAG: hypothetical protein ACFE8L_02955 [Candidatus Hodarchaeota archaeon]